MTHHRLDALLRPHSIAIVGASDKPDSNGHAMVSMCRIDGYAGNVYPVNPRLNEVDGLRCYPTLASLPEVPEHVVIGIASRRVEAILDEAIALGAKAATIFAACYLEDDEEPTLSDRIAAKAREAGMEVCGANCMGFYTPREGLRVASAHSPPGLRSGGIAWIAQSGSVFAALSHNDRRLGFSVCVSSGMELVTSVADYMDWALEQPETRVIGLFLETIRKPAGFVCALQKANARGIPVVALKVGRTEKSARMALSHSGAIAGNTAAYDAVCRCYGVSQVSEIDELAATLALFDTPREAAPGLLGTVHDSGGERELVVDLATDAGLEFAEITEETRSELAAHLEPGLVAENPLDAYGTNTDVLNRFAELTTALVNDPNVALGLFIANPRDRYVYAEEYTASLLKAAGKTDKPLAMVSNYSMVDDRGLSRSLMNEEIPLLRGTRNALLAAKHVLAFRDFDPSPRALSPEDLRNAEPWRERLRSGARLSEQEGLQMLSAFGLGTPRMAAVSGPDELENTLAALTFPLALKTAEDHAHKSDVGGVVLDIPCSESARAAYAAMARALGPRALLMEMAPKGTELSLGALYDDSFGPVILISAGGTLIEFLDDSVSALAPIDVDGSRRLLKELRITRLLSGVRGQAPADQENVAHQISRFSHMIAALGDAFSEIDINPLICTSQGSVAVDCLVIGR